MNTLCFSVIRSPQRYIHMQFKTQTEHVSFLTRLHAWEINRTFSIATLQLPEDSQSPSFESQGLSVFLIVAHIIVIPCKSQ